MQYGASSPTKFRVFLPSGNLSGGNLQAPTGGKSMSYPTGALDHYFDSQAGYFKEEPPECERCQCELRSTHEKQMGICTLCQTFLSIEPNEP
jgi:hypothetical protein